MHLTLKNDQFKLHEIGDKGDGYSTTADLQAAYKAVQKRVDAQAEVFAQVNVDKTMKLLVHAGSLLRVAYAAAGDSNAAPVILKLFSKHQSFLGDCVTTTGAFVQGCMNALEHHFDALDMLQDDDDNNKERAMRALARCGEIAKNMANEANKVVIKSREMETVSEDALVEAKKSQVITVKEKKAIEKERDESRSKKKRREAEINELNDQITDLGTQEKKFEKKADRESARASQMMLLRSVCGMAATMAMGPMSAFAIPKDYDTDATSNGKKTQLDTSDQERELRKKRDQGASNLAKKEVEVKKVEREIENLKNEGDSSATTEKIANAEEEKKKAHTEVEQLQKVVNDAKSDLNNLASRHIAAAVSAEAKASAVAARKYVKLDQRRQAAGDLAAAAEDLANLKTVRDELVKAIKALDVCVQLMGQIKTTFTNVRIFWEAIANYCKDLSTYDEQRMKDTPIQKFGRHVEKQMIRWISLGRLNYTANNAIRHALKSVDEGMHTLPTKAEAQKILEQEADGIAKMLKAEYEKIDVLEYASAEEMVVG